MVSCVGVRFLCMIMAVLGRIMMRFGEAPYRHIYFLLAASPPFPVKLSLSCYTRIVYTGMIPQY